MSSLKALNGQLGFRQLWQQARADKTPGVPAKKVLDRLERKYQAMADEAGKTE
jgi:antitoxin ParD1/3/4